MDDHEILPDCDEQKRYDGIFIYCGKLGFGVRGETTTSVWEEGKEKQKPILTEFAISCSHRILFGQCPKKLKFKIEHNCDCRLCYVHKKLEGELKKTKND